MKALLNKERPALLQSISESARDHALVRMAEICECCWSWPPTARIALSSLQEELDDVCRADSVLIRNSWKSVHHSFDETITTSDSSSLETCTEETELAEDRTSESGYQVYFLQEPMLSNAAPQKATSYHLDKIILELQAAYVIVAGWATDIKLKL